MILQVTLKLHDLPSTNNQIQEEFIDMLNDESAKNVYTKMCCSDFWIAMIQTFLKTAFVTGKSVIF